MEKDITKDEVNLAEELLKAQEAAQEAKALADAEILKRKQAESALVNYRPAPSEKPKLEDPSVYAKKLSKAKNLSNKDFWETSLKYRESTLNKTGKDVWTPTGEVTAESKDLVRAITDILDTSETDIDFRMKMNNKLVEDRQISMYLAQKARAK